MTNARYKVIKQESNVVLKHPVALILQFRTRTGVPELKVNILGGHSIGHSKKKSLYEHVSYSERFPIYSAQYFEFGAQYIPSLPQ
jgi:hypothetical protein